MNLLNKTLFKTAHPATLGLFRFLYGLICIVHVVDQWPYIAVNFITPEFHFSYPGLSWIQPIPGIGMYVIHGVMLLSALVFTLGISYRKSLGLFLALFLYVFLIDASYYKNHYYLTFLIGFLLYFTPANQCFVFRQPKQPKPTYAWHIYILRFQFCIVYFYAGLAKLNWDWWSGEPLRHLLQSGAAAERSGLLQPLYQSELFIFTMIYGGAIFDVFVPFLLINRKTRKYAAIAAIFFHFSNHLIFPNILIFPFLMMFSLVIFFNSDWPSRNRYLRYYCKVRSNDESPNKQPNKSVLVGILSVFCLLQILLPLRHHLYPGDILWTSQGEHFAWRMILKREKAKLKMYVVDPQTGERQKPDEGLINFRQFVVMKTRPRFILQFAHFLADRSGIANAQVVAENWHSINGRDYQLKIKPTVDLLQIKHSDNYMDWMVPFDNRLPNPR